MAAYAQSVAYTRMFMMIDSTDHITGKTGLTVTTTISKAGAAFGAPGGAVSEISSGWYKIALNTTDTNTLGDLGFHCTATGADATDFTDQIIDPVRGLGAPTALPNANAGAVGGLLINGTNSGTTVLAAMTISGIVNLSDGLAIARSTTNTSGLTVTGNGTGSGAVFTSGSGATGDGIQATAASTNGNGFAHLGTGTGSGFKTTGGATGNGIQIIGGATSGDGMKITTTFGHALNLVPIGTSVHGILTTGGNSGISDGFKAVAGTGGVPIRGNITGNITGTIDTTTSVTNRVTANTDQWAGGTIPSPNVTGVPKVDIIDINGVPVSAGTAQIAVNVIQIAGAAVDTTTAQLGVNVVNVKGAASAGTAGYMGVDWQNVRAATAVVTLTNTTIGTATNVTNRVTANVDQIDGASWSTHASGMAPADLRDIAGAAIDTTAAQLGVNLVNIKGTASAGTAGYIGPDWQNVRAATAVVTLTNTTIGTATNVTNRVTANTDQWAGTTIPAPNFAGVPKVDVVDIAGSPVNSAGTAQISVNVIQISGQPALLDANNLLKVDVEDIKGTGTAGTAGYMGVDWQNIRAATTVVALTNTTIGTTTTVTNRVTANVDQIDGASWSTHAVGMAPADLRDIAGTAVNTSSAQLGVNIVNIKGIASAGAAGYVGPDWNNINAATTVVTLTNTTIGTATNVTNRVTANADQIDGVAWSTHATGMAPADLRDIAGAAVNAASAQLGVNVVTVAGAASNIKKNQAMANFQFLMTDSTTHAPAPGLTVSATRDIDNAGFGACANAVSEIANGWYVINLAASDVNGNNIALRFTAVGADDRCVTLITQP